MPSPVPASPRRLLGEILAVYVCANVVVAVLYATHAVERYFHAVVAALFLYLPAAVLWRRGEELESFGLRLRPLGRGLLLVAVAVLVLFPGFALGFGLWHRLACAHPALSALVLGPCPAPNLGEIHWRLPNSPWQAGLAELLVVALPEEFFFRGYLQGRLTALWPPRHRLWGAPLGLDVLLGAALFALSHLVVQGNPGTLAVFFPGLVFGWMRARTGSIVPGAVFHALCNLYIETLQLSFFG